MIRVNVSTRKHKSVKREDIFGGAYFISHEQTEHIMIIEKLDGGYIMVGVDFFKILENSNKVIDSRESIAQWLDARGYRPFNVKLVEDE